MTTKELKHVIDILGMRFKSHPWHGIELGNDFPNLVNSFIEIVPSDKIKYEVDKESGYLIIDRPQKYSSYPPALYGFIPKTYCGDKTAAYCMEATGRTGIVGDEDPIDIMVITERQVDHGDIIAQAIPVGGFRMLDGGESDDKIIAVLKDDQAYGNIQDISELPSAIVDRLKHFFVTYKDLPGNPTKVEITHTYGAEEAKKIIELTAQDYADKYGDAKENLLASFAEALK
ncbi:MAG: inorganic pyrophosphatase [Crocinitomicaceae bacterium]